MRWPLRKFYTFNHLVDSYRNTLSKWAVGFRYENFTLKLARWKKRLASCGPTVLGRQYFLRVGYPILLSTGRWMVMLEIKAKIHWHTSILENIIERKKKMVRTIIVNESSFWPAIRIATFEPAWTHVGRPDSKQFTTIFTWQTGSRHFTQNIYKGKKIIVCTSAYNIHG